MAELNRQLIGMLDLMCRKTCDAKAGSPLGLSVSMGVALTWFSSLLSLSRRC